MIIHRVVMVIIMNMNLVQLILMMRMREEVMEALEQVQAMAEVVLWDLVEIVVLVY